jgi:predicted dehydrogenase
MCEKPIATTLADAKEIVDKAKELNAFLQIGFELRYSTLYTTVKKWIDDGLLGDIVNTSCTYICSEFHGKGSWRNVKSTGGNMVGEKLSHYLDLARWWTGSNVKDIYTACAPNIVPYYEVHDNYHMTYRFKNGAIGHMTFVMAVAATFHGDPLQDVLAQQRGDGHDLQFLIVGTKGAAQTNVFNRSLKRWEFGDSEKCLTSNWVENITWSADEDHYRFHNTTDQTLDIVRRVKESLPPKTSAEDAFETMKLCFAAEISADTGCITELSKVTD